MTIHDHTQAKTAVVNIQGVERRLLADRPRKRNFCFAADQLKRRNINEWQLGSPDTQRADVVSKKRLIGASERDRAPSRFQKNTLRFAAQVESRY
ncbi:hypothetical protein [Thalassovita autumnalis]|uniref:hypothetical protein n=1 Tax=Thalassovita autumnalis TaxID=2072972 RepID=UPI00071C71C2|nr:hypothetical protein [Thalassovita autumnalis]